MQKTIICLSFDDGRIDNYEVCKEVLEPLHIPATINITTGYVDGTCPKEYKPSNKKALSISNVIELFENPLFEIALHGDFHKNTVDDINSCRKKLIKWFDLPEEYKFGFASPGSGFPINDFINSSEPLFRDNIIYLRTSGCFEKKDYYSIIARKLSRIIRCALPFVIAYKNTVMTCCSNRIIYSVPVMKQNTLQQIKTLIEYATKKKGCVTFMFHSIGDSKNDDNWTWGKDSFIDLCNYLYHEQTMGRIIVQTQKQLYEYLSQNNS